MASQISIARREGNLRNLAIRAARRRQAEGTVLVAARTIGGTPMPRAKNKESREGGLSALEGDLRKALGRSFLRWEKDNVKGTKAPSESGQK
jgi:hypothetical protein